MNALMQDDARSCFKTNQPSSYVFLVDHNDNKIVRPVLLAINLQYRPSSPKTFPRWNYKKADWKKFSRLIDEC